MHCSLGLLGNSGVLQKGSLDQRCVCWGCARASKLSGR